MVATPEVNRNHIPTDLSPEQIIDLKRKFAENPMLLHHVCAEIAVQMNVSRDDYDGSAYPTPEAEHGAFVEIAFDAGMTAASYAVNLQNALDMPGSEWHLNANLTDWITGAIDDIPDRLTQFSKGTKTDG